MKLRFALYFSLLASLGLFLSCSADPRVIKVYTDTPEFYSLAAQYQAEHPDRIILIESDPNVSEVLSGNQSADLIISKDLNNPALYRYYRNLQEKDANYKQLDPKELVSFALIQKAQEVPLVMLSYDLPVLVSLGTTVKGDFFEQALFDFKDLKALGDAVPAGAEIKNLSFSPQMNPDFLYQYFIYEEAQIRSNPRGYPEWDKVNLLKALDALKTWCTRIAGSPEKEQDFLEQYAYIPLPALLETERVKYGYMTASQFLELPSILVSKLTFKYLSLNQHISLAGTPLYAAIPLSASTPELANDLLNWMLQEDTQKKYLATLGEASQQSFGFLGGFSTNRLVNEKYLPSQEPYLSTLIPPEENIVPPANTPLKGAQYLAETFTAWLKSALISSDSDPEASLQDRTNRWYLQQGLDP